MKHHFLHAFLWVSMSWLVNYAYSFHIGVPIHTIIRSSNVVATLVIGIAATTWIYMRLQPMYAAQATVLVAASP